METSKITNRSAPNSTVVPILIYEDVGEAINWLCRSFGFKEHLRAEHESIIGHAQLAIAECAIILGRQGGPYRTPPKDETSQYVLVHVEDVDGHFENAKQNGASIIQSPTDMPFGERQYTAQDPWGHWWTFSQHIADVAPEEWGAKTS
jgi:uncharacterized glyoxalase superfamily protein PhnB